MISPNPEDFTDTIHHQIIDELHPRFKPYSDEEMINNQETYGTFRRLFKHKNKKIFQLTWRVYYGTPKTVRVVFEPTVIIKNETN